MTRRTEPAFTAAVRRSARADDPSLPLGVRLDRQARDHGFGTWSALLAADPAETPYDCPSPGRWDGEGAACHSSTSFVGTEADLLRLCVLQLAADVRAIDFEAIAGPGCDFEAMGAPHRLTSWVWVRPNWCARLPCDAATFDHDVQEATERRIQDALSAGTANMDSHLSSLMSRKAMMKAFHGSTCVVDVRGGHVHRVAIRLMQNGEFIWEARIDVGYRSLSCSTATYPRCRA